MKKIITQIIDLLYKYSLDISYIEIEEKYSEFHRFYHILPHPLFLIKKINELYEQGVINEEERDILIIAALFHDIIYNPQRTDNEEQSVEFLKSKKTITHSHIDKACDIIFATKTHKRTGDKLIDIFCGLDMYNLSNGSFINILSDERKVFKEYQFVDYATYKEKRIEFLESVIPTWGNDENIRLLIDWIRNSQIKVGIYAGSFNPFHKGHLDILQKGQRIFDKVILAIGVNPEKSTSDEYKNTLKSNIQSLREKLNIEICFYEGLLTDFIQEKEKYDKIDITLIRGLRDGFDLSYENRQIQFMKEIYPELKTVYIQSDRNLDHISSSAIRHLEKYNPDLVKKYLI